ncbi:MAG: hypothetical protein E7112_00335 [Bacteroidales bacterium]|nr:hypothetical protein [Bacteroidales bacterium]
MEYVDDAGRHIGIEITECWWRDVELPEMDDYTISACAKYKALTESRGEKDYGLLLVSSIHML